MSLINALWFKTCSRSMNSVFLYLRLAVMFVCESFSKRHAKSGNFSACRNKSFLNVSTIRIRISNISFYSCYQAPPEDEDEDYETESDEETKKRKKQKVAPGKEGPSEKKVRARVCVDTFCRISLVFSAFNFESSICDCCVVEEAVAKVP